LAEGGREPLLNIQVLILVPEAADTANLYAINNCLRGLRGIAFGNFMISLIVSEFPTELPNIQVCYTLSPSPRFSRGLRAKSNEDGFTHVRLLRLLADHVRNVTQAARRRDPVEALFQLLEELLAHRNVFSEPLVRLALA
jgi:hypothetical protein